MKAIMALNSKNESIYLYNSTYNYSKIDMQPVLKIILKNLQGV